MRTLLYHGMWVTEDERDFLLDVARLPRRARLLIALLVDELLDQRAA